MNTKKELRQLQKEITLIREHNERDKYGQDAKVIINRLCDFIEVLAEGYLR